MLFFRLRLPIYSSCDCMIKYVPLIMFRRAEVLVERTWFMTSGLELNRIGVGPKVIGL